MATPKLKQTPAIGGSASEPQREVERLIEKGRIKEAFKEAKRFLFRQNSPENRRLVERTYLLRLEELVRGGMQSSAAEVANSFLEFGVTDPQTLEALILILPRVGMSSQALALGGRLVSPEAQASLSLKIADEAVLRPTQAANCTAEIRAGAERIRAALGAIERSSEQEALDLLKDIPRNSPWADWRYFVRGLAAFYRQDYDQAGENWNRLDPQRTASSIAAVLQRTLPAALRLPERSGNLSRLEIAVFGEQLLTRLEDLQRHFDQKGAKPVDWQKTCQMLTPLSRGLQRFDPRLGERFTEMLLEPIFVAAIKLPYVEARRLVENFTKAVQPLPLDQHWNRLWALLWERAEGDLEPAIEHWRKYVTDVERLTSLAPNERRRLQALVLRRVGEMLIDMDDGPPDFPPGDTFLPGKKVRSSRRLQMTPAVDALEQSLRLDPAQRPTYEMLMKLHGDCDQPEALAEVARRCVAAFPDDLEALRSLIEHHRRRDEPEEMLRYVERARVAQPLEVRLVNDENWARLGRARYFAAAGRIEEARAEFARADELAPEQAQSFRMLARRAALEYRAGQTEQAEELVREAQGKLAEPTALWLLLSIEAVRYGLPPPLRRQYRDAWIGAIVKKKVSSETAGQLAEILLGFQLSGLTYTGHPDHIADVVKYLGRTTRTKYRDEDLRNVCSFLQAAGSDRALLAKLTKKGLKSFPKSFVYQSLSADLEMEKGPLECNIPKMIKYIQAAVRLAEESTVAADREYAPDLKRRLLALEDIRGAMSALPFGGRGGGPGFDRNLQDVILKMMAGMDDDLEDEEFESDEDDFFFGPPPRRRPPSPAPRKRK